MANPFKYIYTLYFDFAIVFICVFMLSHNTINYSKIKIFNKKKHGRERERERDREKKERKKEKELPFATININLNFLYV